MATLAIRQIAELYGEKVRSFLQPRMVILYGSQARGDADETSDIDVAVVVDRIDGDFLDAEIALYRARRGIDDRIEPVLLEYGRDPSGFLASIMRTGDIVFSREGFSHR